MGGGRGDDASDRTPRKEEEEHTSELNAEIWWCFGAHTDSYIESSLSISSLPRGGDPFPAIAVAVIGTARELAGEDSRSGNMPAWAPAWKMMVPCIYSSSHSGATLRVCGKPALYFLLFLVVAYSWFRRPRERRSSERA